MTGELRAGCRIEFLGDFVALGATNSPRNPEPSGIAAPTPIDEAAPDVSENHRATRATEVS